MLRHQRYRSNMAQRLVRCGSSGSGAPNPPPQDKNAMIDDMEECGRGKFAIPHVTLEDGTIVVIDEEPDDQERIQT